LEVQHLSSIPLWLGRKSLSEHKGVSQKSSSRKPSAAHVSQSPKQNLKRSSENHMALAHCVPQMRNAKKGLHVLGRIVWV